MILDLEVARRTLQPVVTGQRNQGKLEFYGHVSEVRYNQAGEVVGSGQFCNAFGPTQKQCRIALQAEMRRRGLPELDRDATWLPMEFFV